MSVFYKQKETLNWVYKILNQIEYDSVIVLVYDFKKMSYRTYSVY